jgi:hypothetical protein
MNAIIPLAMAQLTASLQIARQIHDRVRSTGPVTPPAAMPPPGTRDEPPSFRAPPRITADDLFACKVQTSRRC